MITLDNIYQPQDNEAEFVDFCYAACLEFATKEYKDKDLYFIQIGANDGVSNDSLYSHIIKNDNWRGLFVEPIKESFQLLQHNYKDKKNVIFENVAITKKNEIREMQYVPRKNIDTTNPNIPSYISGCSTLLHTGPLNGYYCTQDEYKEIQKITETVDVQCTYLHNILDKHKIDVVDIIHVDAEGADWMILRQLNLHKYKPYIIHFECMHLYENELSEAVTILEHFKYYVYKYRGNITAVQFKLDFQLNEKSDS